MRVRLSRVPLGVHAGLSCACPSARARGFPVRPPGRVRRAVPCRWLSRTHPWARTRLSCACPGTHARLAYTPLSLCGSGPCVPSGHVPKAGPVRPTRGYLAMCRCRTTLACIASFFFLTELFQFSFSTECSWEVHAPGLMLGIRVPGMYMPGMCPPKKCVPGRCTLLGVLTCEAHAC